MIASQTAMHGVKGYVTACQCDKSSTCLVAHNAGFCQIWRRERSWRPCGPMEPGTLRGPDGIGPLRRLYSKHTGLIVSPLPSYGTTKGLFVHFFVPDSGLAETAHFQPTTLMG